MTLPLTAAGAGSQSDAGSTGSPLDSAASTVFSSRAAQSLPAGALAFSLALVVAFALAAASAIWPSVWPVLSSMPSPSLSVKNAKGDHESQLLPPGGWYGVKGEGAGSMITGSTGSSGSCSSRSSSCRVKRCP